jgi:hypothetical protein
MGAGVLIILGDQNMRRTNTFTFLGNQVSSADYQDNAVIMGAGVLIILGDHL